MPQFMSIIFILLGCTLAFYGIKLNDITRPEVTGIKRIKKYTTFPIGFLLITIGIFYLSNKID